MLISLVIPEDKEGLCRTGCARKEKSNDLDKNSIHSFQATVFLKITRGATEGGS